MNIYFVVSKLAQDRIPDAMPYNLLVWQRGRIQTILNLSRQTNYLNQTLPGPAQTESQYLEAPKIPQHRPDLMNCWLDSFPRNGL